ncbi:glycosyltransferase family 2 protein [Hymenobacter sp. BT507]|uniref:Glycosyltransferase family 2 protein n=1 Tax=Hymenobacter citatus TaxID=2763506 RepID=A0ABR7MGR0_9BACT|nr:glycosyltransferase family 2 protein [Hymenobacter citatus]MBC6610241.1 glycosyltransferase family 2 protein [Hymenobacter citatus]
MRDSSLEQGEAFVRIPKQPPRILPTAPGSKRYTWSVMIPAYNCIAYLHHTITSVLAQDPGADVMQIEVVDDYSTDGDVQAMVYALAKGRVSYYRQQHNVGSLRNFETCINRAQGEWVHILHGDDVVEPGFYAEIQHLFTQFPEAGAAFTNSSFIDEKGEFLIGKKPLTEQPGLLENFAVENAKYQHLDPPCMVVKRKVYEQLGGFFAVHYGEDWEMWTRIAAHFPVAYSPKCLAGYRTLQRDNITSKSFMSGQNIADSLKVIQIIQNYLPDSEKATCKKIALQRASIYIAHIANGLYLRDKPAAFRQLHGALQMDQNPKTIYLAVKLYMKYIIQYKYIHRYFIQNKYVATVLTALKKKYAN